MIRRGNRDEKWWTCQPCQTRWERRSLESLIQTGPVTGNEIMLTGRHLGETFSSIMNSDPAYCQLAVSSAEQEPSTHPSLRRFAQYIAEVEAQTVHTTPSQSSQTREDQGAQARTRRRTESDVEASSEESFRLILNSPAR